MGEWTDKTWMKRDFIEISEKTNSKKKQIPESWGIMS